MDAVTSAEGTLRVAVIGAGPAGIYVADALCAQADHPVQVDIIDRLPAPFGLLRYGVAPDHIKMKNLSSTLQRILEHESVRFFGNVNVGEDVTVALSPADFVVVDGNTADVDRTRNITVIEDASLAPGDATATCGATVVDARLSTGLARVHAVLTDGAAR